MPDCSIFIFCNLAVCIFRLHVWFLFCNFPAPVPPHSSDVPVIAGEKRKPILPCGAIANSMFSDVIELYKDDTKVPVLRKGIAWESDKQYKFRNPSWYKDAKNCSYPKWNDYAKPKGTFSTCQLNRTLLLHLFELNMCI